MSIKFSMHKFYEDLYLRVFNFFAIEKSVKLSTNIIKVCIIC